MKAWFLHGWALDPSIWGDLAPRLDALEPILADRGYFGPAACTPPDEEAIWITHSLGAMLALHLMNDRCRALVIINGFDRFSEGEGTGGVASRVLDRMIARVDHDPDAAVAAFRTRCGAEPAGRVTDPARLREDLLALRDMDCRGQARDLSVPVLSLQGRGDPILPEALRERTLNDLPQVRHCCHPHAGHLLPVQDAEWCAREIGRFLAETV